MAKFSPLHDRILVRRVEEASTTRGGIIIPDSAKDKPQEGEVISTGKGRTNDEGKTFPLAVKEGDRILFGKYSGTEIKIDGEDFIIMKEEEVLGILTGAASPAKKELAGSPQVSRVPSGCHPERSRFSAKRRISRASVHRSARADSLKRNPQVILQELIRRKSNGKTNRTRRRVPPGNPARRQPSGRRSEGHPRPQGPQRGHRKEIRFADHHQRRRNRSQRNRTEGRPREHGRPDGSRSRLARPPTSPATAPPPPPFSPRRFIAKA